jgi:hypothetical protein
LTAAAAPGIAAVERFAPPAAFIIDPAAGPAAAPDAVRVAAAVCAALAAAPGAAAAAPEAAAPAAATPAPAQSVPAPDDPVDRCSPAERRPTCNAASRAAASEAVAAPDAPAAPAADPTEAPTRAPVSRNHPAGATGSVGVNAGLSAFGACLCIDTWRDEVAVPVRSTGSICAA